MSTESVKQRLASATPGPWEADGSDVWGDITSDTNDFVIGYCLGACARKDADFIAHARTDLELAVDVIEAARATLHHFTGETATRDSFCVVCSGESDHGTVYECRARERLREALQSWDAATRPSATTECRAPKAERSTEPPARGHVVNA